MTFFLGQFARLQTAHCPLRGLGAVIFILLSACNPTINDKKGEEYVAAQNAKKGAAAFADLSGQIANSQFPDGVVTASKIDSAYTSTLATKTYADSYMLGYALPAISTFTDNQTIRWRTATSSWEVFTPGAATGVNSLTVGSGLTNGGTATDPSLSVSGVTSAMITDGTIVNADINAAAAIDGSKVTPAFGAQNISTTGTLSAGATTLSGALALGANNLTSTGSATFASLTLSSTPLAVSSGGTGLATVGTANYVFASPNGATGAPSFRALVAADIPTVSGSQVSGGTFGAVNGSALTNLDAGNLASGTILAARMPALTGDVTTSAGAVATTIANNAVTTAKINAQAVTDVKLSGISSNCAAQQVARMDGSGNFACSYPTAIQITQTAHGFAVGNAVYYNNSTPAYALVLSTDASFGDQGVGIVSKVVSANVFEFVPNGFIGGLSGLTANTYYYLSSVTAGAISTSAPTTGYTLPVFYALSTTTGTVLPWKPMYKSGTIIQTAYDQTSANTAITGTISPIVAPAITDGDEILSLTFTPRATGSNIRIEWSATGSENMNSGDSWGSIMYIVGDAAPRVSVFNNEYTVSAGINGGTTHGMYQLTSPGTAAFTVKIRAGANAGASTLNKTHFWDGASGGYSNAGHLMYSWLKIEEIQP